MSWLDDYCTYRLVGDHHRLRFTQQSARPLRLPLRQREVGEIEQRRAERSLIARLGPPGAALLQRHLSCFEPAFRQQPHPTIDPVRNLRSPAGRLPPGRGTALGARALRRDRRLGIATEPRTETGKVQRFRLCQIAAEQRRDYRRHWTPVHLDFVVPDLAPALAGAERAGALREGEVQTHSWGRIATLADPFGHGFCLIEFLGRGDDEIAGAAS
jgi:hypothetical protein